MNIVASSCLNIFLAVQTPQMTPAEVQTAEAWAHQRSSQVKAEDIFAFWERMRTSLPEQKSNYLRLELSKLRASPSAVNFDPLQTLKTLSMANVENYQNVLLPLFVSVPKTLPKDIDFIYSRPYLDLGKGVFPPLVNSRDMVRNGFAPESSFYGSLITESATVGFKVGVHDRATGSFEDSPLRFGSHLLLSSRRTADFDFLIPYFATSNDLISFFAFWKPHVLEDFLATNRFNLPRRVQTVSDLLAELNSNLTLGLNLDTLHSSLKDWILRPEDYENLYRWAQARGLEGRLPQFERRIPFGVNANEFYFLADPSTGWGLSFPRGRHYHPHAPPPP